MALMDPARTATSTRTPTAPWRALYDRSRTAVNGTVLAVVDDLVGSDAVAVARALAIRRGLGVDVLRIARAAPAAAAAMAIDTAAREARADVIVVGVPPPGDSADGAGATALVLMRLVDVPLLVVASGRRELPKRALVLAGGGASAARVAHVAVGSIDRPGAVVLAHVREPSARDGRPVPPGRAFHEARAAAMQLRRVESGLDLPRGIRFDKTVRSGDPVDSALRLARERRVDLIATAVPGVSVPERVLLGRHTARLVEDGRFSVLAVPTAGLVPDGGAVA